MFILVGVASIEFISIKTHSCNPFRPKSKLLYSIVQNQPGECEVALFAAQFKVYKLPYVFFLGYHLYMNFTLHMTFDTEIRNL